MTARILVTYAIESATARARWLTPLGTCIKDSGSMTVERGEVSKRTQMVNGTMDSGSSIYDMEMEKLPPKEEKCLLVSGKVAKNTARAAPSIPMA